MFVLLYVKLLQTFKHANIKKLTLKITIRNIKEEVILFKILKTALNIYLRI